MSEEEVRSQNLPPPEEDTFVPGPEHITLGDRLRQFGRRMLIPPSNKYLIKGVNPEQVKEDIEYAKKHRDTLRSRLIAGGPQFDWALKHLEQYEWTVDEFNGKWMTNDLHEKWAQSFAAMYNDGLKDIMHAVESLKPTVADIDIAQRPVDHSPRRDPAAEKSEGNVTDDKAESNDKVGSRRDE